MYDLNNHGIQQALVGYLCAEFYCLQIMFVNKNWYKLIREFLINLGKNTLVTYFERVKDLEKRMIYNALLRFVVISKNLTIYIKPRDPGRFYRITSELPNKIKHGCTEPQVIYCGFDGDIEIKYEPRIYAIGKLLYKLPLID